MELTVAALTISYLSGIVGIIKSSKTWDDKNKVSRFKVTKLGLLLMILATSGYGIGIRLSYNATISSYDQKNLLDTLNRQLRERKIEANVASELHRELLVALFKKMTKLEDGFDNHSNLSKSDISIIKEMKNDLIKYSPYVKQVNDTLNKRPPIKSSSLDKLAKTSKSEEAIPSNETSKKLTVADEIKNSNLEDKSSNKEEQELKPEYDSKGRIKIPLRRYIKEPKYFKHEVTLKLPYFRSKIQNQSVDDVSCDFTFYNIIDVGEYVSFKGITKEEKVDFEFNHLTESLEVHINVYCNYWIVDDLYSTYFDGIAFLEMRNSRSMFAYRSYFYQPNRSSGDRNLTDKRNRQIYLNMQE